MDGALAILFITLFCMTPFIFVILESTGSIAHTSTDAELYVKHHFDDDIPEKGMCEWWNANRCEYNELKIKIHPNNIEYPPLYCEDTKLIARYTNDIIDRAYCQQKKEAKALFRSYHNVRLTSEEVSIMDELKRKYLTSQYEEKRTYDYALYKIEGNSNE